MHQCLIQDHFLGDEDISFCGGTCIQSKGRGFLIGRHSEFPWAISANATHLSLHESSPPKINNRDLSAAHSIINMPLPYAHYQEFSSQSTVLPITDTSVTVLPAPLLKHEASFSLCITPPYSISAFKHAGTIGFAPTRDTAQ